MRKASSLLPPLQRLPPLIKCKKKLSFLWPFIIACGICWSFFKPDNFSAKKTEEEKRAAAVKGTGELSLLSRVRRGGSFEGCRRLFVLGFLFGLLLYGLVRNVIGIFSLSMKKFHWYFGRRRRSAYNGYLFHFVRLSRPFFAILSMLLTYSVTLAVWQSCMSSCEERKCLGATPFKDFPTLSEVSVVTLLLYC